MASNFEKTVEFCGKNYKKEVIKILLIDFLFLLVSFGLYYYFRNITYAAAPLGVLAIIDYLLLSSYFSTKKMIEEARIKEFIQIVSYFQIFISNHLNVYQCFKQLIPYSSEWMGKQITFLLQEVDTDKTVQPFVNFAHKFKAPIVENVMLSIYQMVDTGETAEQLNQFSIFFGQLEKSAQKNQLDAKERSLASVDSLPLFGAGIITIIIVISVLTMMGDLIDVV